MGGCETMLPLYRGRHNEIRDKLAEILSDHSPDWEVELEHEIGTSERPDIVIKTPTHTWWLDVAITYEDATLFAVEKKFNEKRRKYGPDGAGIIFGHSGLIFQKSLWFLCEMGLSRRKSEQIAFTLGAIVLSHVARLISAYISG
ncbi:hypothetical protein ADUPG1_001925 [Aduncisulcus paluster]|uniref:Restriction endonuclease n=1 Tax=Aduncisulcus paluster TaxID=2918883 RepID=A0ABQ5KFE2_9EUKA|nr:hypothetical protein ADUPG1_001925 [Aduncisulcus paluster]